MSWQEKHSEELRLLGNALQTEGFRFILITHYNPSVYRLVRDWLRERFPERVTLELPLLGLDYRQFSDRLESFSQGIVLIPDMSQLLSEENQAFALAFNQRRDHFARKKLAFICFLRPSSIKALFEALPDWWSLRSLELEIGGEGKHNVFWLPSQRFRPNDFPDYFPLLLGSYVEKENEITSLLRQLEDTEENNLALRQQLNYLLGQYYRSIDEMQEAIKYQKMALTLAELINDDLAKIRSCHELGDITFGLGDNETALHYFEIALEKIQYSEPLEEYGRAATLQKIGRVYKAMKNKEKALQYLEEALALQENDEKEKSTLGDHTISVLWDIASVYKDLEGNEYQYFEWIIKAFDLAIKNNDAPIIYEIGEELGLYLCEQGDIIHGLYFLETALQAVQALNAISLFKEAAPRLAETIRYYQQLNAQANSSPSDQ